MSDIRKRILEEIEHVGKDVAAEDDETIWLLSYADLMTLLFTFFVMLYA